MQRKACYLALGVRMDGERDVLGMWFQDTEGAKFWMHVLGDLKRRGVSDILICCVDGLTGFPEAIEAIFPNHRPNLCCAPDPPIVALRPPARVDQVAKDLKPIYTASDADAAWQALEAFDEKWASGSRRSFRPGKTPGSTSRLSYVRPRSPPRLYTTNAIEALNRQLRKAIKTKGHFPTEDAARKLIYLAIQNAVPQWTRTRAWTKALLAFKIQFGDRLPDTAI